MLPKNRLDRSVQAEERAPDGGIPAATIALPPRTPQAAISELTRAGLLIDCEVEVGGDQRY
jgi:hypothetical protein